MATFGFVAGGLIAAPLTLLLLFVLAPLGLLAMVFWIWMLVDAIQNKGLSDGEKIGWVLAIVFLHIIAAFLYLLIGRPKRNQPRPA